MDPTSEVERWRRRVARERQARLEAERIAETALRDLYNRERGMRLLSDVAVLANGSSSARDAYSAVLRLLRHFTGWDVGHVWEPTATSSSALESTGIWQATDSTFAADVRRTSLGRTFQSGEGMPGEVLATGRLVFVSSIAAARNFPRRQDLTEGAALAFPVLVGDEVAAVIELLDPHPQPADPALLEIASTIGFQLGEVVSRQRSRRVQEAARDSLESEVRSRTLELSSTLESANALLAFRADLIASLNHRIRTPLHKLIGSLELQIEQDQNGRTSADLVGTAQELDQSLNELLELFDADSANVEGAREAEVDLCAIVASAIRDAQELVPKVGVRAAQFDVQADRAMTAVIVSDEHEVRRAVTALVSCMAARGGAFAVNLTWIGQAVSIELQQHESWVVQAGPEEGDNASHDRPDRSLVMARARLAANRLGGDLELDRNQGAGCLLSFPARLSFDHADHLPRRVLLVDDTEATRRIATAMLAKLGIEADSAVGGAEAVAMLESGEFGLVFMDCNMPIVDGYQATALIRAGNAGEQARGIPIVALTADGGAGHWERCRRAGMSDFLAKPFRLADLEAMANRWLTPDP